VPEQRKPGVQVKEHRDEDMSARKPLLAFFGHHKCATTWISDILGQVCRFLKLNYVVVPNAKAFRHDLDDFVIRESIDVLGYVNANYRYVRELPDILGFHVVRDPRDVCVSAYFSHLHSHPIDPSWPELAEIRARLQSMSQDDGLLYEMDLLKWVYQHMYSWDYTTDRILEVRMEDLIHDPYGHMLDIFGFLRLIDTRKYSLQRKLAHVGFDGLRAVESQSRDVLSIPVVPRQLPAERLLGIVWENRFEEKTAGRRHGDQDQRSHYRKGVAGDWRKHLKAEHIRIFKKKYNQTLVKLGYEQDLDWGLSL
jgi:hypothetical protein